MAKKKATRKSTSKKSTSKKTASKKATAKRSDAAKEIKQAEKRLEMAIAEVEAARAKVTRRERDLADLLARHGHAGPAVAIVESVIALDAPSSDPAENGSAEVEPEAESEEPDQEVVDQHDVPTSDPAENGSAEVEPEAESGEPDQEVVDQHE